MQNKFLKDEDRDLNDVEDEINNTLNHLRKIKVHKQDDWVNDHIKNSNSAPPNNCTFLKIFIKKY